MLPRWWRKRFLIVEAVLVAGAWVLVVVWVERFGGSNWVDHLLGGNRAAFYGALAAVLGALFGFAIAAIAILLPYSDSDMFAVLRESGQAAALWRTFSSALVWLAMSTPAALAALLLDRDSGPNHVVGEVCLLTTALATARLARVVWILSKVLSGIARNQSST